LALGFARVEQAGVCAGEIGVVVTGVGDEFPNAGGQAVEQSGEGNGREGSGGENAECAAGGGEAFFSHDAQESGLKQTKHAKLGAAERQSGGCGAEAPDWLEGIAHGADAGGAGGAQDRTQHGGKDVRVLVGVDMGEVEAAALQQGDLRGGFCLDFAGMNAGGEEAAEKCAKSGPEAAGARVGERGERGRREDREAVE